MEQQIRGNLKSCPFLNEKGAMAISALCIQAQSYCCSPLQALGTFPGCYSRVGARHNGACKVLTTTLSKAKELVCKVPIPLFSVFVSQCLSTVCVLQAPHTATLCRFLTRVLFLYRAWCLRQRVMCYIPCAVTACAMPWTT